jgi:hypothetical protein
MQMKNKGLEEHECCSNNNNNIGMEKWVVWKELSEFYIVTAVGEIMEKWFQKRVWEYGKILDWEARIWVMPNPSWGKIAGNGSKVPYGGAHIGYPKGGMVRLVYN